MNVDQLGNKSSRLRAERERLGLSQADLAERLEQSRKTQVRYESGERSPDWEYLEALLRHGADVHYILTGERLDAAPMASAAELPQRLRERLVSAISAVEAGLEATGRVAAPDVKAELILAAYDLLGRDGEAATAQIIRLVTAA